MRRDSPYPVDPDTMATADMLCMVLEPADTSIDRTYVVLVQASSVQDPSVPALITAGGSCVVGWRTARHARPKPVVFEVKAKAASDHRMNEDVPCNI